MANVAPQAVREARNAIRIAPKIAEPHLWLAEALRFYRDCDQAQKEYSKYLRMSAFDSNVGGKASYYLLGSLIGHGTKTYLAQHDIWAEMQSQANFGICDCARSQRQWNRAIEYCRAALRFDPSDLFTQYNLGVVLLEQFNAANDIALLRAARGHFRNVIVFNDKTQEADDARKYIEQIDGALKRQ